MKMMPSFQIQTRVGSVPDVVIIQQFIIINTIINIIIISIIIREGIWGEWNVFKCQILRFLLAEHARQPLLLWQSHVVRHILQQSLWQMLPS
jgi:hypothetical protein